MNHPLARASFVFVKNKKQNPNSLNIPPIHCNPYRDKEAEDWSKVRYSRFATSDARESNYKILLSSIKEIRNKKHIVFNKFLFVWGLWNTVLIDDFDSFTLCFLKCPDLSYTKLCVNFVQFLCFVCLACASHMDCISERKKKKNLMFFSYVLFVSVPSSYTMCSLLIFKFCICL